MKNVGIAIVWAFVLISAVFAWKAYQGQDKNNENSTPVSYPLVIELAVPVTEIAKTTDTGVRIGRNPEIVSITVTLQFISEHTMNEARNGIRHIRRAYTNSVGPYLSNRDGSDDVWDGISSMVSKTSDELFGKETISTFDVTGELGTILTN